MTATAAPATTAAVNALAEQRFVSLTTFRRSGIPVPTPVWVGWDDGALVVTTPRGSGKVTRLLRRKYGLEYFAVMGLERLGSPRVADRVVLRITPPTAPGRGGRPQP